MTDPQMKEAQRSQGRGFTDADNDSWTVLLLKGLEMSGKGRLPLKSASHPDSEALS